MKELLNQLDRMGTALGDPEYLYLVLEPLLFYGIGFGLLLFIITFFLKNERLQISALIVVAVMALAIVPYMKNRAAAQPRIESVYKVSDASRVSGFRNNTIDRKDHRWLYLTLAGVAGAAILVGPRRNKLGLGLAGATVLLGLYTANYSLWMHYQDSLAFHPNLKSNSDAPVKKKIAERERETKPAASRPVAKPVAASESPEPSPTQRKIREVKPLE